MGSTRYSKYNKSAKEIWQRAANKTIFLFASYIVSEDNYVGDALSRIKNINVELKSCDQAFHLITERFGELELDLFANKHNNKCNKFAFCQPDSRACVIDAL